MTASNKSTLSRKVAVALGAIVVSTVAIANASQANAGVNVYLGFGNAPVYGGYYGPGWGGPNCYYFKKKWQKTGKFFWKKKYFKCKGWW